MFLNDWMNERYALSYSIFIVIKFNIKMPKYQNKPLHLEDLQVTLKKIGTLEIRSIFWYVPWKCYMLPYLMEKAMAPHSSTLAWKIPWMEEPGGLQSMGSLRLGHDWTTSLSLFTCMHWRRKWQPTPVFLPGESQGRGSLVGCCLWGRAESDTTEAT